MGFRIIDRHLAREKRMENDRSRLLFEEAQRFSSNRADNIEKDRAEFLEKIAKIRQSISSQAAKEQAGKLEESIRKNEAKGLLTHNKLGPSILTDLL